MKASIKPGAICAMLYSAELWESPTSWTKIGSRTAGQQIVADGVPEVPGSIGPENPIKNKVFGIIMLKTL